MDQTAVTELGFADWEGSNEPVQEVNRETQEQQSSESDAPTATDENAAGSETANDNQEPKAPAEAKPEGKRTARERIQELTAERNREREGRAALEARIRELEARSNTAAQPATPKAQEPAQEQPLPKFPKLSDFDYDEDKHAEAVQKWTEQRDAAIEAKRQQQTQQQQYNQRIRESIEAAEKKYPDFQQVALGQHVSITPVMAEHLIDEGAAGADLAYYLGKNPEESKRIAQLSPRQQIAALVRLQLNLPAAPSVPEKQKSATAYRPPTNLAPSAGSAKPESTFEAWEKMQVRKRS